MNSAALVSRSSVTTGSAGMASDGVCISVATTLPVSEPRVGSRRHFHTPAVPAILVIPASSLDLDALLFEIFLRARMERDRRADRLVLEVDVLRFLVHGHELWFFFEQRLYDAVGHRIAHLVVGDEDVPDVDVLVGLVLARI